MITGNFVANTRLPLTLELRKDWQHARVLRQSRNGCSTSAACWERGPRVLDVARVKPHPCPRRAAAMLVLLVWGDETLSS